VINDGRLTLGDGGKMKLDTNSFPISMAELEHKKKSGVHGSSQNDQGQECGHFR
jgi:hypothetical protein